MRKVRFKRVCDACPETFDFFTRRYIGYLRTRYGHFQIVAADGTRLLEGRNEGFGWFTEEERGKYLATAEILLTQHLLSRGITSPRRRQKRRRPSRRGRKQRPTEQCSSAPSSRT